MRCDRGTITLSQYEEIVLRDNFIAVRGDVCAINRSQYEVILRDKSIAVRGNVCVIHLSQNEVIFAPENLSQSEVIVVR